VADLDAVRDELARVMAPGGILLALMPTSETLWEDHLKLPFVHRMQAGSENQRRAIRMLHRAGIYRSPERPQALWEAHAVNFLRHDVFHRSVAGYMARFAPAFRLVGQDEPSWMRMRLKSHRRLRWSAGLLRAPLFNGPLRHAMRRLAGAILVFQKV
jgi:hypothetical protein